MHFKAAFWCALSFCIFSCSHCVWRKTGMQGAVTAGLCWCNLCNIQLYTEQDCILCGGFCQLTWPLHAFFCKCHFCLFVCLLSYHESATVQQQTASVCVFVYRHATLRSSSVFLLLSLLSFCLLLSVSFPFVTLSASIRLLSHSASCRLFLLTFSSPLKCWSPFPAVSCHREVCVFSLKHHPYLLMS